MSDDSESICKTIKLTLNSSSNAATEAITFDPGYDSKNFQKLIASGQLTPEKLEQIIIDDDLDPFSYLEEYDEPMVYIDDDPDPFTYLDDEIVEVYEESIQSVNSEGFNIAEWEINLVCQMIQHELGSDPNFFPGYDFNHLQQCEARVILNRLGTHGWNNVADIILAKNQFVPSLDEISSFNPYEPTTRANVMKVLRGEDGIRDDLLISMSWSYGMDKAEALKRTEELAGCEIGYHEWFYANYGDFKQLCIFAAAA